MTIRFASASPVPENAPAEWTGLGPVPRWKRMLDLSVGTIALLALAPVMIVAASLIRVTGRGPVLFRQTRVGRGERPYSMLKFRTMRELSDDSVEDRLAIIGELDGTARRDPSSKLYRPAHDPRVTRVGRFLRRFSIDELPQLFNVVRGDMSLVGPRPAPPSEVGLFAPSQRLRHQCLPGITGLWQVSGRNRMSSREMLALDLEYVERCSLRLDLAILLRTPRAVLFDRFTR